MWHLDPRIVSVPCDVAEGDDGSVDVPAFGELKGLADTLAKDELRAELVIEAESFEGLSSGAAVGSVVRICDGDLSVAWVRQLPELSRG